VRLAIGVLKTNGIAAVEVNQIVDDERAWITRAIVMPLIASCCRYQKCD
jgi:hypothetical protein